MEAGLHSGVGARALYPRQLSRGEIGDLRDHSLFDRSFWPRRIKCAGPNLEQGQDVEIFETALNFPYIEANPPWARQLMVLDIDTADAVSAWERGGTMPPTVMVVKPTGRAHVIFKIRVPVMLEGKGVRQGPIRLESAVYDRFRVVLGGDPHYNRLLMRNPAFLPPLVNGRIDPDLAQDVYITEGAEYELGEMLECIPDSVYEEKLKREAELYGRRAAGRRRGQLEFNLAEAREVPDHMRNVALFDFMIRWANVDYETFRGDRGRWIARCEAMACVCRTKSKLDGELTDAECEAVGRSVAQYVFEHWRPREEFIALTHTPEQQRERALRSAEVRREASKPRIARAIEMSAQGLPLRGIAAQLGVHYSTVSKWLKDVRA